MTDLVSRLRVEVAVGDSAAKLDQVKAGVVGIGQAGAQASGGLSGAAASERELQAASAGASAATAALQAEVTQLIQAMIGVRGGLTAASAATVANAEASAVATAATAAQALATRELGAVQAAATAGMGAQAGASKALGAATGLVGEAMGGATAAGGGLSALVGGPLALGVVAATVVMDLFHRAIDAVKEANERVKQSLATSVDILGELKKEAADTAEYTVNLSLAMGDSANQSDLTSSAYDRQAASAAGAARAIRDMTLAQQVQDLQKGEKEVKDLKAAQRTKGVLGLVVTDVEERAVNTRGSALDAIYGNETQRRFLRQSDAELMAQARANRLTLAPDDRKKLDAANQAEAAAEVNRHALQVREARNEALRQSINGGQPEQPNLVDEITVTADRNKKTKANTAGIRATNTAKDTAADIAAETAHTAAIIAGGKALDDWQVSEAGRQAVEKLALADKPKLTAAETAQFAQIRSNAEETERLKLANERLIKGADLTRSAEADTAALKKRADAAGQGVAAMEALSIKEAGLDALHKIGVDSLDQLTGKTLEQAKAAMTAAEAAEAQTIATAKAERVADQVRDLDKRIASEKAYTAALGQGVVGIVAYQRAEFVRQEVEKAGENLTQEQIATLKAKAEALFAVQAAANSADLTRQLTDELHLAQLTNQEREVEQRFLERKSLLLAEHADWTEKEVDARARALALADQAAADDAAAIGKLREDLRSEFIKTGHLAFDDIADYARQKLRAAVYDALLAKPIDIIINAVVGSVTGLGSGGAGAGAAGLASLFNKSGSLAGLASGTGNAITDLLMKTGMGGLNAAKFGGMAGNAIGGAGTGLLVSSVAGMLGLKQSKGNQIGGAIGGIAGSFIPIPGGSLIGSVIGNVIGGLIGGKKSNSAAVVTLDGTGNVTGVAGDKRTSETEAAATSVAQGVATLEQALIAAGAKLTTTVTSIDLGVRDQTHIGLSSGASLQTAVGDTKAAIEAATKAIVAGAQWGSEAATAYAQKMINAGASLDDIVATMQAAAALPKSIDDAIKQLTDPAGFAKDQALAAVEASYQALKAQAQQMIDAGLVSADVLAKIDQLHGLQIDDALKQLAGQVETTADAFAEAKPRLIAWIDSLATSANSPLNAMEQRAAALEQYQRELELARAGNTDALAAITGYADQLLSADHEATSSAADRAALYAQVQADIAALAQQTEAAKNARPEIELVSADFGPVSASIEASNAKLGQQLDALSARVGQLAQQSAQGAAELVGELVDGLRTLAQHLDSGFNGTVGAIDDLTTESKLTNATLRKAVIS